jgi:hypothetical protein
MIDVKTAVNSAYDYLRTVQNMMGGELEEIRLEEVELSEDKHSWLVTLGYDLPVKNRSQIEALMTAADSLRKVFKREYKLFSINSETGEVEAMKIRQV